MQVDVPYMDPMGIVMGIHPSPQEIRPY